MMVPTGVVIAVLALLAVFAAAVVFILYEDWKAFDGNDWARVQWQHPEGEGDGTGKG